MDLGPRKRTSSPRQGPDYDDGNTWRSKRVKEEQAELYTNCQKIDFSRLFHERTTYEFGNVRQVFYNACCPLCTMIAGHITKAHGHLDINREIIEADIQRKVYSKSSFDYTRVMEYFHMYIGLDSRPPGCQEGPYDFNAKLHLMPPFDLLGELAVKIASGNSKSMLRQPLQPSMDTNIVRKWLHTCDNSHDHQRRIGKSVKAPIEDKVAHLQRKNRFRLIDVQTNTVVEISGAVRYFALSYVWGNGIAHHAANLRAGALQHSDLPRSIRDALILVRRLGERYLWVDSLCIDQSNAEEKADVVSRMGDTYTGAYATIIEAAGSDAEAGISRLHYDTTRGERPVTFESKQGRVSLLPCLVPLEGLIIGTKWASRAWTYQERLLSNRCLFLLKTEVIFSCSDSLRREAYCLEDKASDIAQRRPLVSMHYYDRSMALEPLTLDDYRSIIT